MVRRYDKYGSKIAFTSFINRKTLILSFCLSVFLFKKIFLKNLKTALILLQNKYDLKMLGLDIINLFG